MENIARDSTDADKWKCSWFKMRQLDRFGTMYGFHVRGSYRYQTKVGALFSLLYIGLVILTFAFYILKWADKTQPFVMWNEYTDVKYADMDLDKENLNFYFVGMGMSRGTKVAWDDFWGSFHLYASILDLSEHRLFTNIHWDNIP